MNEALFNKLSEPLSKIEVADATTYNYKAPFIAKVVSNEKLVHENSDDDVRNIRIDLTGSGIDYREGQSIGVIPPGQRENGKPHQPRLYSISSKRGGDEGFPGTVTFCVKRDIYIDPATGNKHLGLCSNYLCDSKPGDSLPLTGPTGKLFLPVPGMDLILISTGTGIAPYRAFADAIDAGCFPASSVDFYFVVKPTRNVFT